MVLTGKRFNQPPFHEQQNEQQAGAGPIPDQR
jgi:hypothetical protein